MELCPLSPEERAKTEDQSSGAFPASSYNLIPLDIVISPPASSLAYSTSASEASIGGWSRCESSSYPTSVIAGLAVSNGRVDLPYPGEVGGRVRGLAGLDLVPDVGELLLPAGCEEYDASGDAPTSIEPLAPSRPPEGARPDAAADEADREASRGVNEPGSSAKTGRWEAWRFPRILADMTQLFCRIIPPCFGLDST